MNHKFIIPVKIEINCIMEIQGNSIEEAIVSAKSTKLVKSIDLSEDTQYKIIPDKDLINNKLYMQFIKEKIQTVEQDKE